MIQGEHYRITVLTKSLVRLEYSPDGIFTDAPTQTVLNRNFPQVSFEVRETPEELEIRTEYFQLNYDKKNSPVTVFPAMPWACREETEMPGVTE